MLYCSLINSHLCYGILIWGYECHRFENIQTLFSKYNAHTEPLFKALDLLTIQDMLDLSTLKFYYRYVHDNLPAYFCSFRIETQETKHNYDTRNRDPSIFWHLLRKWRLSHVFNVWSGGFHGSGYKALVEVARRRKWRITKIIPVFLTLGRIFTTESVVNHNTAFKFNVD